MIGRPPSVEPGGSGAITKYALLTMDRLQLLIPQNQVRALEPGFDVEFPDEGGVGWIAIAGNRSPVYCLSEDLKPLRDPPANRHICVLLDIGTGPFGVLCDQVEMFEQAEFGVRPLPGCMQARDVPLRGLVLSGDEVLCVGSAHDLLTCLGEEQRPAGALAPAQMLSGGAL